MIGLDTNVPVRYLTQDDPAQSAHANAFVERQLSPADPGIIGHIVLCEVGWVLSRAYGYTREQVADALGALLTCREFRVESPGPILAFSPCRTIGTARPTSPITSWAAPISAWVPGTRPHLAARRHKRRSLCCWLDWSSRPRRLPVPGFRYR